MTANVGANIGAASPEAALAAPAPADGSESESESEWSESAEAEAAALFGPCGGGGGGGEEEEDGREEAASDWLRRSRTALAEALADPPSDADYVLFGRGFGGRGADSLAAVASAEFFSGSGPGTGAGPAGEALARFEAAEGRRRRWKEARGGGGGGSGGSGIPSILRSVRRGTGLGFVDAALAVAAPAEASSDGAEGGRELKRKQKQKRKRKAGTGAKPQPVLEVAGPAGAGKTALLLTLAANYVACTGTGCYLEQEGPDLDLDLDWAAYGLGGGKGTGAAAEGAVDLGLLPAAVILDSELGVRPEALVAAVRAAVLRRWGETARTRAELGGRSRGGGREATATARKRRRQGPEDEEQDEGGSEWRRVEAEVASALGRIHVIQAKSGGCRLATDGMPVLESLRHSLDHRAAAFAASASRSSFPPPPVLLLIDSVTSSARSERRLEALGPGLSGRNDFLRQLSRLRAAHPVAVVGTATTEPKTWPRGPGSGCGGGNTADPWARMVSARIVLGAELLASTAPRGSGGTAAAVQAPFRITTGGVVG